MCISVLPNGTSYSKGTHVSLVFYTVRDANTGTEMVCYTPSHYPGHEPHHGTMGQRVH